ncbi:MAG: hypothetical protein SFT92_05570 [Rickettsiales bacterium]|nr:hypothetical protein [Rickettsiales bacterium]
MGATPTTLREILNPFHNAEPAAVGREKAGALIDWMSKEATRIGLKEAPLLFQIQHEFPNAGGAFAGDLGHKRGMVFVTDGLFKHVFDSPDLSTHVPEGLKAMIGHEMHHIKDISRGIDGVGLRKIPIFTLPIISVIGYELYADAKRRHAKDPSQSMLDYLNGATDEAKAAARAKHPEWYQHEQRSLDWSHRIAALAGGLLAGSLVARHMSLSAELRADRAAVIASGHKPEVYIDTLSKIHKELDTRISPLINQWFKEVPERSFMENAAQLIDGLKHEFTVFSYHAHPDLGRRLDTIRQFSASESHAAKLAETAAKALPGIVH